jgi:hypothetical protein
MLGSEWKNKRRALVEPADWCQAGDWVAEATPSKKCSRTRAISLVNEYPIATLFLDRIDFQK